MAFAYTPPPLGLNYISSIEACYTFVLISLPLSSVLVPILLLILFFSTHSSRRTLLFALNILIVLLGIVEGVLSTIVQSIIILRPQHPVSDPLFLAYIGIAIYTPIIVDCVLILRLSAVYPANIIPRTTRLAILAVPLLCTVARIACVTVFVRRWDALGHEMSALMAGDIIWSRNPMVIADWSIQLFENMYCSALFLYRLQEHKAFSSRMYRQQSIAARLRAVFYIAISNFVFPTILSAFQLTYIIRDPSVVHGATILMVNNYVSIIGVVFSTIWCSSDVWKGTHNARPSVPLGRSAYDVAFPQSIITLSGIAPNLNLSPIEPHGSHHSSHTHAHSHSTSRGHRPHPFANSPYGEIDLDLKDSVDGVNIARTMKGDAEDSFLQTLTLPVSRGHKELDVDADAEESASCCPSPSPITPHDVRLDVAGPKGMVVHAEKGAQRWDAPAAPPIPLPPHPLAERRRRSAAFEVYHRNGDDTPGPDASSSDSDMDIELDFATPTPPPADRRWHRHRRRSRSLSASLDYHHHAHDALSHARDRDVGEIRLSVSPAFAEDEPGISPFEGDEPDRHSRAIVQDDRHLRVLRADDLRSRASSSEDERLPPARPRPRPQAVLDDDRPSPAPSRAHRPSFMDWSDAEPGSNTPASWDTRSLDEP